MTNLRSSAPPTTRLPVCICTDLGYDPDDLLAMIIAAAALPLRLVVTSDEFGGGERARLARYLLNLCGRTGVVVVAGKDIEGAEARWVCDGLVPPGFPPASMPITGSTVEAVRTVVGEGHRAAWVGLGPVSNLAWLYRGAPELARLLVITLQGGGPAHLYRDPSRASHNPRMDPASARAIWTAPDLDLRLVTSGVTFTEDTEITRDSEIYRLLAADNSPKWAKLVADGYDRWFARKRPGSKAADPMTVTAAAGLPFVNFDAVRVAIGPDARMHLDPNGNAVRMSTSADYASFRNWVTMVVRHALESGMGYEPSLIGRLPSAPGPATVAAAPIGRRS
ncbi:nucleoside hydrolase [Nocardia veterana]|uniref:Nucleoside hydrolase n=1 Tax=Nocardia veterana TaxID=132249 RepID=A0A7X6LZI6_9NOCA|nr:nucleoside hydrolase [Nocardia veterana]NKY87525.1 nucleoside hydrolase [Nocardia veterana]